MTIKSRLSISNFLMIVIPTILALVIGFIGIAVIWIPLVHQNNIGVRDLEDFEKASTFIVQQTSEKLMSEDRKGKREISTAAEYLRSITGYTVQIIAEDGDVQTFGSESAEDIETLRLAADHLNKPGIVSIGTNAVNKSVVATPRGTYVLYVYGTELKTRVWPGRTAAKVALVLIAVAVMLTIFLTNRFLTRFVFQHIQEALEELSKGVHQIRDGNLGIRIQHKTADEFSPICEDFNDMAERLKKSVSLIQNQEKNRKELLAGMSHDLRSPLTSIKAYTEGLIDGVAKTPEAQARYLAMIQTKVNEIESMITNLFTFSKMDLEEYPCYPEILDLEKEVTALIRQNSDEYQARGLKLDCSQLHACGKIYADPGQLRSVISNIIGNSLKYKEQASGCVSIKSSYDANGIRLFIEDDGPGVPKEALTKLFEVFYRSDPSRSNTQKGSGLGLAIAQKAVFRMGGSIWAENVEPHGLRMVLIFPEYKEALF